MTCAMSSFAYSEGDYAFLKNGRVKITGENLITNGTFGDATTGWTDAAGEPVNAETWAVEPGEGENGENVIMSQGATEGAALARVMKLDAGTYVVSYQIRAAGETTSGITTIGESIGSNYFDIFLNTSGELNKAASTEDALVANIATAENFNGEWTTVNYYFEVSDSVGAPQMLAIHVEKMATGVQITNFSVNTADEVYDIRIAQKKIDFAKLLLADPNFDTPEAADAKADMEGNVIPMIEAMIENNELDDVTTAEGLMGEEGFEGALNAYLDASSINIGKDDTYFKYVSDLTAFPKYNRGNISNGQIIGGFKFYGDNWLHAQGAENLNKQIQGTYENPEGKVALYNQYLPAGKYYIAAEVRNAYCDKNYNYTYTLEKNVKAFVGSNEVELGTIVGEDYVKYYIVAEFDGNGPFEAGFWWEGHNAGSAFNIKNFEIRSFEEVAAGVEHKQAFEKFIAQYNAMLAARAKVVSMQGKKDYPWDQATLAAALEKYDPYYNAIVAKGWVTSDGEDAGVATTEELNDWALYQGVEEYTEPDEEGNTKRLEYQVVRGYQNAANAVIESNKPIADLFAAINNAKSVRNNPKNVNADKTIIDPAIKAASDLYKEIYANTNDDRRDTDVANIESMIQALAEAVESFEATAEIKPIVDIDFSTAVAQNDAGEYVAIGSAGEMVLNPYSDNNDDGSNFALGYTDALTDVLRIGKGTAVATFDAPSDNDIIEVNFDMWYGKLVNRTTGIELQNENGTRVAGFTFNSYNAVVGYNEFNDDANSGMDINGYVTGIGSGSASNGAICVDNNKSTFKLVINYAEGTVQGTVVNAQKGTCTGNPIKIQEMDDNKVTRFVITSNYDNKDRRCWFDNLKIFKFVGAAGIQGDVNGDEHVDVADISSILTVMANGGNDAVADVNGDGYVDVADISTVLTIMAGGE